MTLSLSRAKKKLFPLVRFWTGGLFLMLVAACSTTTPTRGPVSVPPVPPTSVKKIPVEEVTPLALPARKLAVALLVPVTGKYARIGQSIVNAAGMALEDSADKKIILTVYDTATNPEATAKLAVAEGNKVFFGPLLSANAKMVHPIAQNARIPMFTFSNDSSLAGKNVYVLGFQPDQSVKRVIFHARAKGVENFAALIPAGPYGTRASESFSRNVQTAQGNVTRLEIFHKTYDSLALSVNRLMEPAEFSTEFSPGSPHSGENPTPSLDMQALLIADTGQRVRTILPLLRQRGLEAQKIRLLGTELWASSPELAQIPEMQGAWFAAVPKDSFDQLAQRYEEQFGSTPSRLASLGYDISLLVNSFSQTQEGQNAVFAREKLNDPAGFVGVDGLFRFQNNIAQRSLEIREIQQGEFTTVSPAPKQFQSDDF